MRRFIIVLIMLLLMTIRAFPGETLEKEFNMAKGKSLDIDLKAGGSINITGWEKEKVTLTVLFKKTTPDQWDIRFRETPEGLEIEANFKGGEQHLLFSPDFEIRTPSQFDLKLKTMGGNINIKGVTGEITGRTMGGGLELVNLKGTIDLKTMGGDITLKDSDIDGKLKTMGGRVLFENVTGNVKGSSMGGNVIYTNVKPRETRYPADSADPSEHSGEASGKAGEAVKISTMGGDINVSDAPAGADVHTMGGNIHIKSAGNFVKAKTMGGNIAVDSINGGIKATTMAGNITVTMTGDPQKGDRDVKLESMSGDITLSVPEGLSMDVDIELAYTQNTQKNYAIVSDFPLKLEKPDTWDESRGSPRKTIYGKAQIAGAAHKIKINTINGNIYLKKLK